MQVNVPHPEWRVLREIARSKEPSVGSALRLEMSRRTRDGSFLTDLVKMGLLKVETKAKDPFEAYYSLTERGSMPRSTGSLRWSSRSTRSSRRRRVVEWLQKTFMAEQVK